MKITLSSPSLHHLMWLYHTYDYSHKSGIVSTFILTPSDAPLWASNREQLWNEVERIEKASNTRTAREVEIALPKELTREQNIQVARAYAQTFVNEGMIADMSIHDKGGLCCKNYGGTRWA